jgi:DNA processing protein
VNGHEARPGARLPACPGPAARVPDSERLACATLTYLAEPADLLLGSLLRLLAPAQVLASITSGRIPADALGALADAQAAGLGVTLARWRLRLRAVPADAGLAAHAARGISLVCPGDPGWPPSLDDLGTARPYALWVRGTADLRSCCGKSVAIIGARAATTYGTQVSAELAADLARRGWSIASGAAYGIDASAHHGALAAGGRTVAVLPCGPDIAYPRAHRGLLDDITAHGAVLSEWPPGTRPARHRFLLRNRVITALATGTVVVEAAERGGTLAAARHASDLGRPLMAVPGPVTSPAPAGCHLLIRTGRAARVTSAADVTAHLPTALP